MTLLTLGTASQNSYVHTILLWSSWQCQCISELVFCTLVSAVLKYMDGKQMYVKSILYMSLNLLAMSAQGALRIAHCGGFHSSFNALVSAVNFVAKLLGHPIHWDTETVGCEPSLSSIAVTDQRLFKDALQEIKAWLDLPKNTHEFVMLYLDDQLDLSLWVGTSSSSIHRASGMSL